MTLNNTYPSSTKILNRPVLHKIVKPSIPLYTSSLHIKKTNFYRLSVDMYLQDNLENYSPDFGTISIATSTVFEEGFDILSRRSS